MNDVNKLALSYNNSVYKAIKTEHLENIQNKLPELDRANNAFGRIQGEFVNTHFVLTHTTPIRNLRQILAECERLKQALSDNYFRLKRTNIEIQKLKKREATLEEKNKNGTLTEDESFELELIKLDILEKENSINNTRVYYEAALKDLHNYIEMYEQLKKEKGINDNWDEYDFESEEEEYHIKTSIKQAYNDVLATGKISYGNIDYLLNTGLNVQVVYNDIINFIQNINKIILKTESNLININSNSEFFTSKPLTDFLNEEYNKFKGCSKHALDYKGITSDVYKKFVWFKDQNKNQNKG